MVLLRAVKNNDLEAFIDEASLHSDAIHEKFTKVQSCTHVNWKDVLKFCPEENVLYSQEMHQWELEWESQKWCDFHLAYLEKQAVRFSALKLQTIRVLPVKTMLATISRV